LQPRTFYSTYSKTPIHRLGNHIPDMDILLQKKTWIFPSLQMAPLCIFFAALFYTIFLYPLFYAIFLSPLLYFCAFDRYTYVRQDEVLTSYVLSLDHNLYLASPYLNLTQDYTKRILSGKNSVDIITASPEVTSPSQPRHTRIANILLFFKTNGWYKAKGLASGITTMYTYIEKKVDKYLIFHRFFY
jgi:hypothetical protein